MKLKDLTLEIENFTTEFLKSNKKISMFKTFLQKYFSYEKPYNFRKNASQLID